MRFSSLNNTLNGAVFTIVDKEMKAREQEADLPWLSASFAHRHFPQELILCVSCCMLLRGLKQSAQAISIVKLAFYSGFALGNTTGRYSSQTFNPSLSSGSNLHLLLVSISELLGLPKQEGKKQQEFEK